MEIKGFIESSLLEWEGRLTSVIFLPLCNLRCAYCHACALLEQDELETIPLDRVLGTLRDGAGWLDGVVITGGEPTLHGEDLFELIDQLRGVGLEVMVETNGTHPEWIERLICEARVERLAMDMKAPLTPEHYRRITRREVDVGAIRSSAQAIMRGGIDHEFRVTVVPGLIGTEEVRHIACELDGADTVAIQNFQPYNCLDPTLHDVEPFMPEQVDELAACFEGFARRVLVRGRERGLTFRAGVPVQ